MWSSCAETSTVFAMCCSTWSRAKSKTGFGLHDEASRFALTVANGKKRGFVDAVQQVNKEAGQNRPGVVAFQLQGLSSELHHPDEQKKTPDNAGGSLPISNGACPSPRPWSPHRRDPARTITRLQQIRTDHVVRLLSHLTQRP